MRAEVIHNADVAQDVFEGGHAVFRQAVFKLFAVAARQLQCATDLLLTFQQFGVFLA